MELYTVILETSDPNTGKRLPDVNIPVDFCANLTTDESVEPRAQCLDLRGLTNTQKQFYIYPQKGFGTTIIIKLKSTWNTSSTDPCATNQLIQEYDQYVYGETAEFQLNFKQQQYDSKEGEVTLKQTILAWDFDPTLTTKSIVHVISAKTQVKEGFIVEKSTDHLFLADATNQDNFKTKGSSQKANPLVVATFAIKLSHSQFQETIQYSLYPEVLASVQSVFSVLLIVGTAGVYISKSEIRSSFIDQNLKKYYKSTAYKIIKQESSKSKIIPSSPSTVNTSGQVITKEILKINKEINSKDMNEELTKKLSVSGFKELWKSLFVDSKEDYNKKKEVIQIFMKFLL